MQKSPDKASVKITVSGFVQGVGFRYYVARIASELDITGYARNMWNGSVEIFGEGSRVLLETLVEKSKEGPRHSHVESCKVEWLEFENKYDNFEIL